MRKATKNHFLFLYVIDTANLLQFFVIASKLTLFTSCLVFCVYFIRIYLCAQFTLCVMREKCSSIEIQRRKEKKTNKDTSISSLTMFVY